MILRVKVVKIIEQKSSLQKQKHKIKVNTKDLNIAQDLLNSHKKSPIKNLTKYNSGEFINTFYDKITSQLTKGNSIDVENNVKLPNTNKIIGNKQNFIILYLKYNLIYQIQLMIMIVMIQLNQ